MNCQHSVISSDPWGSPHGFDLGETEPPTQRLNRIPPHRTEVSAYDFIMRPICGLSDNIAFRNLWMHEEQRIEHPLVIRYEDVRSDPDAILRRVMELVSESGADAQGIGRRRLLERREHAHAREGERLLARRWSNQAAQKGNPNSYKVRRAKGGYRDYFDEVQAVVIDELVAKELSWPRLRPLTRARSCRATGQRPARTIHERSAAVGSLATRP